MGKKIPSIIHQIWSGVDGPLPEHFRVLGETWKRDYPNWEYKLWDNRMMNEFKSFILSIGIFITNSLIMSSDGMQYVTLS